MTAAEHASQRLIRFHDQALGDAAAWRLIVVRVKWSAAYGFENEAGARAGALAYMNDPDVRAVWIEPVEGRS